jgi:hypothetical protein
VKVVKANQSRVRVTALSGYAVTGRALDSSPIHPYRPPSGTELTAAQSSAYRNKSKNAKKEKTNAKTKTLTTPAVS